MVLAIIVVVVKIAILKLLGGWDCPRGRRRGLLPQPLLDGCAMWKDMGVHKKKESPYPY
jgi:hypothetical protein